MQSWKILSEILEKSQTPLPFRQSQSVEAPVNKESRKGSSKDPRNESAQIRRSISKDVEESWNKSRGKAINKSLREAGTNQSNHSRIDLAGRKDRCKSLLLPCFFLSFLLWLAPNKWIKYQTNGSRDRNNPAGSGQEHGNRSKDGSPGGRDYLNCSVTVMATPVEGEIRSDWLTTSSPTSTRHLRQKPRRKLRLRKHPHRATPTWKQIERKRHHGITNRSTATGTSHAINRVALGLPTQVSLYDQFMVAIINKNLDGHSMENRHGHRFTALISWRARGASRNAIRSDAIRSTSMR